MNRKSISYAIVDSDDNSSRLIKTAVSEFKDAFNLIGQFSCYKEAGQRFRSKEPDLIFINIKFPFFSGAEMYGQSKIKSSDFVFLAEEDDFVFQNIKAGQFDCLLKPLSTVVLKRTLKRKLDAVNSGRPMNYGFYKPASLDYKYKKLHFPTSNGYLFIHPDEIIYCQADVEYTRIFTSTGKHLISKNLKHFESVLNKKRFVRSHKSYIVNIDHIKLYVRSEGGHIIMSDEKLIPVGRSRKTVFSQLLGV